MGLGALVLLGFLFCISFRSRFAGLSDVRRGTYATWVVFTALAAAPWLARPPISAWYLATGQRSR